MRELDTQVRTEVQIKHWCAGIVIFVQIKFVSELRLCTWPKAWVETILLSGVAFCSFASRLSCAITGSSPLYRYVGISPPGIILADILRIGYFRWSWDVIERYKTDKMGENWLFDRSIDWWLITFIALRAHAFCTQWLSLIILLSLSWAISPWPTTCAMRERLYYLTVCSHSFVAVSIFSRVGDFLTSMVHLDLQQGNLDEAAMHLGDLRQVLGLPVTECGDRKTSSASRRSKKDTMSLVKHSEACRDLSLRILHVRYSLALSRYLAQASQLKQSISALEVTDGLCASAETLMAASLESLTQALELGRVSDANTIAQTKTTKPRASRGRKQKGVESGARGQAALTARCIFGQFSAAVHALNADVLIQSGKLVKARELTAGALEDLGDVVSPGRPVLVSLFPRLAKLYYLSGLTAFLSVACPESDRRWSLCPAGPESVGGSGTEASSAEEPSAVIKAQRATRRGPTKSANANAPGSKTRSTAAQRKERVSTRGRRTRAADEGAQQLSKETATGKGSARPIHEGAASFLQSSHAWPTARFMIPPN